ncbi:MAG TPA: PAS domain-containing protein [Caulobacteraceae bacterium]
MNTQLGAPTTALRAHEELFAYWAGLRQRGTLPCRRDLDPGRIKRLLPTVSLTQVLREPLDYRLRLAGTGLYGVYGGEITGKRLTDVYSEVAAAYWRAELDQVVAEARPRVGQHSMAWRGASHMTLLWLRLPLATNGHDVDVILGYDAVLAPRDQHLSGIRAA